MELATNLKINHRMEKTTKENYDKERAFLRDLLVACEKNELDKVKQMQADLKQHRSNISICDYKDGRKSGAVHAAARGGAKATLEYLLSLNPEQGGLEDAENRTPLMAACSSENGAECVRYLLESNEAARQSVNISSNTVCAVHMAASLNSEESLEYLLKLGKADPNTPSNAGLPIHWAAGHAANARTSVALVKTGIIDIDARDPQGCTPLILASLRGNAELVQYFCDSNADLTLFANNLSALGAAAAGGSKTCAEIILRKGGDQLCLSRDPVENLRPIDVAAHAGCKDVIRLLAEPSGMKGVNPDDLIHQVRKEHEDQMQKLASQTKAADEEASKLKDEGNHFFAQGKFEEAIAKYEAALSPKLSSTIVAMLLCNLSACRLKLEQFEAAKSDALKAKKADPGFTKANYRLAQACSALKDHEAAAAAYWDAYEADKKGADAAKFLQLFKKEIDQGKRAYKAQQDKL